MPLQHRYFVKFERCLPVHAHADDCRGNDSREERKGVYSQYTCIHDNTSFYGLSLRDQDSMVTLFPLSNNMFFSTPFRERQNSPRNASPLLSVRSPSFIQFRLETVHRLFHNAAYRERGVPYGRIYAYFWKIRQTLRRNAAGFAPPLLLFQPSRNPIFPRLTVSRPQFQIMTLLAFPLKTTMYRKHSNNASLA